MSWRDNYLPASFRGVPFYVSAVELESGRRIVEHEYVLRNEVFAEDMGRRKRDFTVEAYVLGPSYTSARDALLSACEQQGPGILVDPYKGAVTVACKGIRIRESADEGGICRITLSFVETGEQKFPAATVDRAFTLAAAAQNVIDVAKGDLIFSMLVTRVPEFVRMAAKGEMDKLAFKLVDMVFPGASYTALSNFRRLADAFAAVTGALSSDPNKAADQIVNSIQSVRATAPAPSIAQKNTELLLDTNPDLEVGTTVMRNAARTNRQAVCDLIKRVALAEQAQNIFLSSYETYESAVAARDGFVGILDAAAATAGDDSFIALQKLRAEVVAGVPGESENLPRIGSLTLKEPMPSLVVAYNLYEEPARSAEIVSRNGVRHPGFVPAGVSLEVLVDA